TAPPFGGRHRHPSACARDAHLETRSSATCVAHHLGSVNREAFLVRPYPTRSRRAPRRSSRTRSAGPGGKQRLTAARLLALLRGEGHQVGYTVLKRSFTCGDDSAGRCSSRSYTSRVASARCSTWNSESMADLVRGDEFAALSAVTALAPP